MKAKHLLFLLAIFLFTSLSLFARRSETGPEDIIPVKLFDKKLLAKNSVIKCEFKQFGYQFGNPNGEGNRLRTIRYNQNGDTLEVLYFDEGQLDRKHIRKYNDAGALTEAANYNPEGELLDKMKYVYDAQGRNSEVWSFKDDQVPEYKDKRTFDENGMLIKETRFLEAEIERNISFKYNDRKQQTEMLNYSGDGELRSKVSTRYDAKGNKTDLIVYEGGEIDSKSKFVYDNNNNLIEEWYHAGDGSLKSKKSYKYDAKNQMIEEAFFDDSEALIQKFEYKLRDDGTILEVAIYEGNNLVNTWKFTFCHPDGLLKQATWYNNIDEPTMHIELKYQPPQSGEKE